MEQVLESSEARCKGWSLKGSISYLVFSSIYLGISICMIIKYAQNGDSGGLFLGIANLVIALCNTLLGTFRIKKTVRRLVAEARSTP